MQFERNAFYRVKAVSEMFDVSVNTIYRAIESGQLKALAIGSGKGTLRISGESLKAYVEQCAQAADEAFATGDESVTSVDDVEGVA